MERMWFLLDVGFSLYFSFGYFAGFVVIIGYGLLCVGVFRDFLSEEDFGGRDGFLKKGVVVSC